MASRSDGEAALAAAGHGQQAEALTGQLRSLTVAALRARLTERGLSTVGRKAELVKRLTEWISSCDVGGAQRRQASRLPPPGNESVTPGDGLASLEAMGFPRGDALAAMKRAGGDVAAAAEILAEGTVVLRPQRKRARPSPATTDGTLLSRSASLASSSDLAGHPSSSNGRPAYRGPPQGTGDRIERALSQRLYLLERRDARGSEVGSTESSESTFVVMGSTGNVYEVLISASPRCNCPDFERRQSPCKHVLFVWLRVLRLESGDPRVWQRKLSMEDVREVLRRCRTRAVGRGLRAPTDAQQRYARLVGCSGEAGQADGQPPQPCRARRALEEDECAICYEAMEEHEEQAGLVTFCLACGANFHKDCIRRWQEKSRKGDCPLCREPFRVPPAHVAPGEAMPAACKVSTRSLQRRGSGQGGYVNLLCGNDDEG